jgi:hypothetical protein
MESLPDLMLLIFLIGKLSIILFIWFIVGFQFLSVILKLVDYRKGIRMNSYRKGTLLLLEKRGEAHG